MRRSSARLWAVVATAHLIAAVAVSFALRIFLTPIERVELVPPQPVRYAAYALAILLVALAAGTVLAAFLRGTTWLPVIYLWSVPFAIVLYPVVDPSAAHFLFVGITGHIGGALAFLASFLWMAGLAGGTGVALFLDGGADPGGATT